MVLLHESHVPLILIDAKIASLTRLRNRWKNETDTKLLRRRFKT